tara:strand:- start:432 stop:803 length:372 start_codon:yes stop_codon:yes gene_type:complete
MIKIIEETLEGHVLKVKVETPLARTARVSKKKYKTKDVIEIIPEKYEILETLQEDIISNYTLGNHKQSGEWHFKVKIIAVPKSAPKKAPLQKKQTTPLKASTKPSTKPSIRGRMSKIAKEKKQ